MQYIVLLRSEGHKGQKLYHACSTNRKKKEEKSDYLRLAIISYLQLDSITAEHLYHPITLQKVRYPLVSTPRLFGNDDRVSLSEVPALSSCSLKSLKYLACTIFKNKQYNGSRQGERGRKGVENVRSSLAKFRDFHPVPSGHTIR